jgi:hypothetical protein
MKLQTVDIDGKTYAEVEDGKPVFMSDDNKRIAFDAPHTIATVNRMNGETKAQREAREGLERRLKDYDGIDDPDAARTALETIRNLKDGDLVKAGEVETVRAAARKAADEQVANEVKRSGLKIKDLEKERDQFRSLYTNEKIGRVFNGSKFINDKCLVPAPMMQSQFGSHFRVEEGNVVAYNGDAKIMSVSRPGDVAEPDEALELLVNAYPFRDAILKGTGSSGAGSRPSNGSSGERRMSRAEFEKLPPMQQRKLALEHVSFYD